MTKSIRPDSRYAERIINLLLQIELNKHDNLRANNNCRLIYVVDADVVGLFIRPLSPQVKLKEIGFYPSDTSAELKQAILTGDYILNGKLPGQKEGDTIYVAPAHAVEISEMRLAIYRNLPKGRERFNSRSVDTSLIDLHNDPRSELILLSNIAQSRITPLERILLMYQDTSFGDFEVQRHYYEAIEAYYSAIEETQRLARLPARSSGSRFSASTSEAGDPRRQIRARRDASALAAISAARDAIRAAEPNTEVLFISNSRHVHAAFAAVARPHHGFDIDSYWIRHPLQYAPYLNLATRKNVGEVGDRSFMFETLEAICRDALKDWQTSLRTFQDILAAEHLSYPSSSSTPSNNFNLLRQLWIANLPTAVAEKNFQILREHWGEVAEKAAMVLNDILKDRVEMLQSKLELFDSPDGIEQSRQAVNDLRLDSLRFDATRDLSRSTIAFHRRFPDPRAHRAVHAPFENVGNENIPRRVRELLNETRDAVQGKLDMLFKQLRDLPPLTLLQYTAITALLSHNWVSARRWAREIAEGALSNQPPTPDTWGIEAENPEVHVRNAWLIRSIAARSSGFDTDNYDVMRRCWHEILERYARDGNRLAFAIAQSERVAIDLFAMLQARFPPSGTGREVLPGPTLNAPDFRCESISSLIRQLVAAKAIAVELKAALPTHCDSLYEVKRQIAINSGILCSFLSIMSRSEDFCPEHDVDDVADWAREHLQAMLDKKEFSEISIASLSLSLLKIVADIDPVSARETMQTWSNSIVQRQSTAPIIIDFALNDALASFGLVEQARSVRYP